MADLELSIIMSDNPRSRAVVDGSVKPEGIRLSGTFGHPAEIFWRQLKSAEFDVSEMSLSSLIMLQAGGSRDWVGLPIFPQRRFFHTWAWIRLGAGIERPEDLKGKRVGVPEYQQTAALWSRGVLQHEFGVSPLDVEWFMERTEEQSHGGSTGFRPPAGLRFQRIPPSESIGSLLLAGGLDATLMYIAGGSAIDRSRGSLEDYPDRFRLLFPDPLAESRRYYAKTGIFPINHGMVVRRSIVERHPWVVLNLFNAFRRAKDAWLAGVNELAATHLSLGLLPPASAEALRIDPYPYGVASNRQVLETVTAYSHEQGLTPRQVPLDEVFAASTMDL